MVQIIEVSKQIADILGEELGLAELQGRDRRALHMAINRISELFKGHSGYDEGSFFGRVSDVQQGTVAELRETEWDAMDLGTQKRLSEDQNHFQWADIELGELDIALGVAYYDSAARNIVYRPTEAIGNPDEVVGLFSETSAGYLGRQIQNTAQKFPENVRAVRVYVQLMQMAGALERQQRDAVAAAAAEAVLDAETPDRPRYPEGS